MKTYPRLSEMGVDNPQQITRYSLSSLDYTDFLKIVYDRPKNSLLPVTKTYRFPRVQQNAGADEVIMKTCPELQEVLEELKGVVAAQSDQREIVQALREEIHRLEEETAIRMEQLKNLVGRIEAK